MSARPIDNALIEAELTRARARTLALVDCLTDGEQTEQVSRLMSPFVWDLAHIGNFEELWLLRELDGRPAIDPSYDDLYNAFEHPRWSRPSLPLLGPSEARAYDAKVRDEAIAVLRRADVRRRDEPGDDRSARLLSEGFVYGMVLQHEHQHGETLLATHQLRGERAIAPPGAGPPRPFVNDPLTPEEVLIDGGAFIMGTSDDPWAYDNERDAREVEVAPYFIDRLPVTNRMFLEFITDGGYDDERLWNAAGWQWRNENAVEHPEFWRPGGEGFTVLRFGRRLALGDLLDEPVQHVSWHEADAFVRWAGKRLPTEAEWEKAATWDPVAGTKRRYPWGDEQPTVEHANLGQRHIGPVTVGAYPLGASAYGVQGMIGDVWEWTSSDFVPYPGFEAFPYREYSEVFFGPEYKVLRGGSWATDRLAVRGTFRNWDFPIRRQIFSGFRGARSA